MDTSEEQTDTVEALNANTSSDRTIAPEPTNTSSSEQSFDISGLLSFDPASMGLIVPGAEALPLQQSANLSHQLRLIRDFLSAPITALIDDSSNIKNIFEQIEPQLPEPFVGVYNIDFHVFFTLSHVLLTQHNTPYSKYWYVPYFIHIGSALLGEDPYEVGCSI
ncbi:uncharacterized protein LOC120713206 [Panicum virgatum]|uniref:uncharacterized protein LOC120713206 n=1 Tax=Panicum virgatum TaxID=38727 RepID=UPI0019D5A578|nr:uncharacterized protein LOC120713206 [Panicum virgatum]